MSAASAALTSNKTEILKKSRTTILQHLEKQGYVVDDYINFNINDIHAMFVANQMDMLVSHKEDPKKVYIKYATETKLTKQMLDDIVEDLYLDENPLLTKHDTLVIISSDEPNDTLQAKVRDLYDIENSTNETDNNRKFVIIINIQRLLFNILEHALQPQFRVLKQDELEKVMQRYNIKNLSQFPEISRFDPVAQCLFMRPRQVCHILRDSLTAVQTSYYRVCV